MCMLLMGCGSAGGGFNPLLYNPALWVEAENSFSDAGITPAVDNDPVYQVDGLRQTSLALRPIYRVNRFGSLPGLVFDGSDDKLDFITPIAQSLPCYVYAVIDTTALDVSYRILLERSNTNSPACYLGGGTSYAPHAWWEAEFGVGSAARKKQIVRWRFTSSDGSTRQDGAAESASSHAKSSLSNWVSVSSTIQHPLVTLGHISIFQGATLNSTFDDNMFEWLNSKYGIY